jgi:hypothetical protein
MEILQEMQKSVDFVLAFSSWLLLLLSIVWFHLKFK